MVKTNNDINNRISDTVYQAVMDNDKPISNLEDFYKAPQELFNNPTEQNMEKITQKYNTDQILSFVDYVLVMANKSDKKSFEQVETRIEPMLESSKLSLPSLDTIDQITKTALQQRVLAFFDKKISAPEFINYYTSADSMKQLINFHDAFLVSKGCTTTEQKQASLIINLSKTILWVKMKLVTHPETSQIEKNAIKKSLETLKKIPVFEKWEFEEEVDMFLEEMVLKDAAGAINPALAKKYTDIGIVFGDMIPGYNPDRFAQDMIKLVVKAKTEKLNKGRAKVSAKKADASISKYIKDHNEDQH